MKKKGFGTHFVILMVIVILIGVATMMLLKNINDAGREISNRQHCRESVRQNALGHMRGLTVDNPIDCPVQEVSITKKQDSKEMLARLMYNCWGDFNRGRYNLFKDETVYCNVCYLVDFGPGTEDIEGFTEYLLDAPAPGNEGSYMKYFMPYSTEDAESVIRQTQAGIADDSIDTSKTQAVIFFYVKGKDNTEKIVRHFTAQTDYGKGGYYFGGAAAGATAAVLIVGTTLSAGTILIAAGAVVAGVSIVSYFASSDNVPEWMSFIALREYYPEELTELGCKVAPSKQNIYDTENQEESA